MNFFTKHGRTLLLAAVTGAVVMLVGSCATTQYSKRPLGPPANEATHAPELVGVWKKTHSYGGKCGEGAWVADGYLLVLRTDGFGVWITQAAFWNEYPIDSWYTDGPVLFAKSDFIPVSGDYTVSGNTLRIKRTVDDCTLEFVLKARNIRQE